MMFEGMVGRLARLIVRMFVVALVAAGVVGVVFMVGMRTKSPGVQRAVRKMNKEFWNPRAMQTAGAPGAYAAVVHHTGRRSGTAYRTPVVPVRTDDAFVIALPYGPGADWVQNVLAAERATVTYEGEDYDVDTPLLVPTEQVEAHFGDSERSVHRAFKVDECLRLHIR